jgi:TolB protein
MKKSLTSFDKTVLAVLVLAALALGFIVWQGDRVGAQIAATFPQDGGEISATGKIGIQFTEPMQSKEVESRLKIEPNIPGHFVWQGNTVWFLFDRILHPGIAYHFQLQAGAAAQDGRKVLQDQNVLFHVRQPDVIYLSSNKGQNDLWIVPAAGGSPNKLTSSGGKVFDFAPSRDGEQIVYSVANAQNGMDLWLIRRDGSQNRILVDCGPDRCSQPAWSPDGTQIVYYREVLFQSAKNTISGIWGVDTSSGQTDFLISGSQPAWSPNGDWIAVMDSIAEVIRVLNVQTGKGIEVKASPDFLPEWQPGGLKLVYADLQSAGALDTVALYQVDLASSQVSRLLDNLPGNLELSVPVFSPDGQELVISMRSFTGGLTKQLWFMTADGKNLQQITQEQTFSNASYTWNAWGTAIVFQRLQMGVSNSSPQVLIWDRVKGDLRVLASQAALPAWLP